MSKHKHRGEEREEQRELHRIERKEDEILQELEELEPKPARSARLVFKDSKGKTAMNITVHINDVPQTAVLTEFAGANGTGLVVPPVGAVTFVSDHPEFVTVDPNTGVLGYVAAGTANITGSDAGDNQSAIGSVTVSAAVAQSSTLTFVAPTPAA